VGLSAAALVWGFAEATLFFIVPDVYLSATAVGCGRRSALRAAAWAIGGAVLGGALMHVWGAVDADGAIAALDRLPAISPAMIAGASDELERHGIAAVIIGGVTGVPYKVYAVLAQEAGIELPLFLLISVPARAGRFLLVVLVADWVNRLLAHRLAPRWRYAALATAWLVFYGLYFAAMAN
jgi:membrane protein YqaA with SNARE-associated domain